MAQNQRQEAIDGFRGGKYDILVATDIAARGIDVAEISHVINFDMPDTVDAYTHRIGRTGRAQATGEAFTFVPPADEPAVRAIEKVLGERLERRRLPDFDYGGFQPEWVAPSAKAQPVRRMAGNSHRSGRPPAGSPHPGFAAAARTPRPQPERSGGPGGAATGAANGRRRPQRGAGRPAY
jgi:ATP-dependent RNA helicase RhlE